LSGSRGRPSRSRPRTAASGRHPGSPPYGRRPDRYDDQRPDDDAGGRGDRAA
jgi:hypothetical protein